MWNNFLERKILGIGCLRDEEATKSKRLFMCLFFFQRPNAPKILMFLYLHNMFLFLSRSSLSDEDLS